jgi:hypothetical protein
MKLIGIATDTPQQGRFVFRAIGEAAAAKRVDLADAVLVSGGAVHHLKGRLSRLFGSGIDDSHARRLAAQAAADSSLVLVLGADAEVEAVALRLRTITDGALRTFDVDGDQLRETTGRDATYELQDTESARRSEPQLDWTEVPMSKQRLEQE